MMRRKNTETSQVTLQKIQIKDYFVYCSQRKCPHEECLRHNVNTPFNVLIHRKDFMPDKDWNCKYITYTKEKINYV